MNDLGILLNFTGMLYVFLVIGGIVRLICKFNQLYIYLAFVLLLINAGYFYDHHNFDFLKYTLYINTIMLGYTFSDIVLFFKKSNP